MNTMTETESKALMDRHLSFFEPLFIETHNTTKKMERWIHPMIGYIKDTFLEQMDECPSNYIGNLLRFRIEYENGKILNTVVLAADQFCDVFGHPKGVKIDTTDHVSMLLTVLVEDIWTPGGKQFVFTKYGKALNKEFNSFSKQLQYYVSPDVSMATDGEDWWFDT